MPHVHVTWFDMFCDLQDDEGWAQGDMLMGLTDCTYQGDHAT